MDITTNKLDNANYSIAVKITKNIIDNKVDTLAKEAGKQLKVDGFRKGKVPAHVVKKLHGERLTQDAESEIVKELLDAGIKELEINPSTVIGQPVFKKYEKHDDGMDVEIEVSITPQINLDGYKEIAPEYKKPRVMTKEVEERVEELVEAQAPFVKIEEDRGVEDGDMTLIDFEGSIDGVAFDGGKAEGFNLRIGSGQFIPGFEEQMKGMKMGEEKTITVKFPDDYHAKDLAGKDADFKVTLHEIQAKAKAVLDDELAKKLLGGTEDATPQKVHEKVKEQIRTEKLSKLYNEELKPKILEALVEKFVFDLPNNIVEQEIDAQVNQKAQSMSPEELETYRNDTTKLDELRESLREDAKASVKATFIVDSMARAEEITVSDDEVSQTIYYEAMMQGQNPQQVIEYYQKNNLIPAIKMGMIEDRLFTKLLNLNNEDEE
ncbi:MAG: trigger factor [Campylobacterales bacterium]|nr:trigger factor [Campylobacterales bacterium]